MNGRELGQHSIQELSWINCRLPWDILNSASTVSITFQHPDAAKPSEIRGGVDEREIALAFETVRLVPAPGRASAVLPSYRSIGSTEEIEAEASKISLRELVMNFENIGENCEFGLVQRRCEAEPLGLLRFSSTPLRRLVNALNARFEDIGRPDLVEVRVSPNGSEYMVLDKKFGFLYHPWVLMGEATPEEIHKRECRRLPFLARKLVEELETADKIFVYKGMRPLADKDVVRLLTATQEYGATTLLWVELQDAQHAAGTVEQIESNLYKGYIDRFAPGENAHDLSLEVWLTICRNAYKMWRIDRWTEQAVRDEPKSERGSIA